MTKIDAGKIVSEAVRGKPAGRSESDFKDRFGATHEGATFKTASGKLIKADGDKLKRPSRD